MRNIRIGTTITLNEFYHLNEEKTPEMKKLNEILATRIKIDKVEEEIDFILVEDGVSCFFFHYFILNSILRNLKNQKIIKKLIPNYQKFISNYQMIIK